MRRILRNKFVKVLGLPADFIEIELRVTVSGYRLTLIKVEVLFDNCVMLKIGETAPHMRRTKFHLATRAYLVYPHKILKPHENG